jgi:predicted regulator of Ras-like GTPase activity (Roadblock/LC7/MglB family)
MSHAVTEKLNQQFSTVLMGLLVKAEAKAVFLCDRGGNILSHSCSENYSHEDNIAALASGSFYATRVLASLLGESEFRHAIHQGAETSMYMQTMECDLLILVVFGKESNPGLVKLYCQESCQEIDRLMAEQANDIQSGSGHAVKFEMDDTKTLFTRAK